MAVTKVSNSGIKTGVLKYDSMLAGNAAYDPAATWLIQRVAGTGSSNTITFSSIPTGYTSLQLRILYKDTSTTDYTVMNAPINLRFNSDTAQNYRAHILYGTGSSALANDSGTGFTALPVYGCYMSSGATFANMMGVSIIDIHDYNSTTRNKTIRNFAGNDGNQSSANRAVTLSSGVWLSTAAVTSITILSAATNFTSTTSIALYGMKG